MTSAGSPVPFIKDEFDDAGQKGGRLMAGMTGSTYTSGWPSPLGNLEMADFNLNNMNGGLMQPSYGNQHIPSSSIVGTAGIADDELEDLLSVSDSNGNQPNSRHQSAVPRTAGFNGSMFTNASHNMPVPGSQQNQYFTSNYSHTTDIQPDHGSFNQKFTSFQFQPQQQGNGQRVQSFAIPNSYTNSMRAAVGMRHGSAGSDSRSPMSANHQEFGNMQLGTPDSGKFSQSVQGIQMQRGHSRRKSSPTQWSNGVNGHSFTDSPLSSPMSVPMNRQISELMGGGKPSSLPTKAEQDRAASSLEAKRQKRRQSHNAVERRRRDNINDRIQELSRLVPQHRLEDDKIRKHLNNHSLPSSIGGNGMSPPQATSLLAGGNGRRAATLPGHGLTFDEKDKGPAKGDVLNGAVGWTRDLMWMLYLKQQQQSMLLETIEQLGGQPPFEIQEDEHRMESELIDAIEKNGVSGFEYSRKSGTGLWVPGHTDYAGNTVTNGQSQSGIDNNLQSPDQGSLQAGQDNQFWEYESNSSNPRGSLDFSKDDDAFGMEMG